MCKAYSIRLGVGLHNHDQQVNDSGQILTEPLPMTPISSFSCSKNML